MQDETKKQKEFLIKREELLKKRPYLAKWLEPNSEKQAPIKTLSRKPIEPQNKEIIKRLLSTTPSRIAVSRTGTRYLTTTALSMLADHAIAKDAVYSETTDSFLDKLAGFNLHTTCDDREDYLLNPAKGRRLDEDSLTLLQNRGVKNVDVQIIIGDGLSAWAAERNVLEMLPYLEKGLQAAGFSFGIHIFVRFARVGIQDHIGVTLNAKATVILLGERPGLGTGDSLSAYIAYNPKLDQDNSEKNCISNIRSLGILPIEAAQQTVEILQRAFVAGRGGIDSL